MFCPDCGVDHHAEDRKRDAAVSAEVEIAKINAERDVRVAELARGETKLAAEAAVEVAEVEGEAQVEEAVVKADVLDEILSPPEPEPEPVVIVDDTTVAEPEPEPEGEPPDAGEPVAAAGGKKANPWW